MSKRAYLNTVARYFGWLLNHRPRIGQRVVFCLLVVSLSGANSLMAQPSTVPQKYRQYFVHYKDNRTFLEKAFNAIGLSDLEVGRSFALIAGVDTYPNLSAKDRFLKPAKVDIERLVGYLRDYEFFDEIIVLRNEAVTDANFKYFLQAYFPDRLSSFPKSRFLFAYSGHGIQQGPRGFLLQSDARSVNDIEYSISLEALTVLYRPVTEQAYYSLALINACHSGSFGSVAFAPGGQRRLLPKDPGSHVITAGTTNQLTWQLGNVGEGSVFFEKFLAGLGGRADDQPVQQNGDRGDGVIIATELFDYLSTEIQLETNQEQQPQLIDFARDKTGSFFFLNRQRQVRANNVPLWERWRNSFGFDELSLPTSGEVLTTLTAEAFGNDKYDRSIDLYTADCDRGNLRACAELGIAYQRGIAGLPIDLKLATDLYRRACDGGDLRGCAYLGGSYEYGVGGLTKDEQEAIRLYQKACDGGEMFGCNNLGAVYENGKGGLTKNELQAFHLYRKACDGGNLLGCSNLGMVYLNGQGGLAKDEQLAISLFQKACDGGDIFNACYNLGRAYWYGQGGLTKNEQQAVSLYQTACERGNMSACSELGFAFEKGLGGLTKDERHAVSLYQKACDGGDMLGCNNLGFAYEYGLGGLIKDGQQAIRLYNKACDNGNMLGCNNLGLAYENGLGGLVRIEYQAVTLYRRACDGGELFGCNNLGFAYANGLGGLIKDEKQAVRLYKEACDGGNMLGCNSLGFAYENGQGGLTKDVDYAVSLYRNACDSGVDYGCNNLKRHTDEG